MVGGRTDGREPWPWLWLWLWLAMPELPAVEFSRRLLQENLVEQTVTSVRAAPDRIVFKGVDPARIEAALVGGRIAEARRHGKFLWLVLSNGAHLVMHFGMTGFVEVQGSGRLRYESAPAAAGADAAADWPPRFWKLEVGTDGGRRFAMGDARRLGRIAVLDTDPMGVPPVCKLGFDPITAMPEMDARFAAAVAARTASLKALLLDQTFAAGVGNWMADDILLHARLHPLTRACDLAADEIGRLHGAIRHVSETAVAAQGDGSRFPAEWLFHVRWPADRRRLRPADDRRVEFIACAGRTTALVPSLQHRKAHHADQPRTPRGKKQKSINR